MATILALDSSIGFSSVAIWHDGVIAAYRENTESSQQSAKLMPLVEETLRAAGLSYNKLDAVACTTGPGSFTGIRIGLASARGIAFAATLPTLGFTTLEVMAHANRNPDTLAILNAGKGEVFFQKFGAAACEPSIGTLDAVLTRFPDAPIASSVPLPALYEKPTITYPRADALAALAATQSECASPLIPFYIRPPDAKPQTALFTAG